MAQGLSSSAKTRSTRGGVPPRVRGAALVVPVEHQGLHPLAGGCRDVALPLRTFETVDGLTPAASAICAIVTCLRDLARAPGGGRWPFTAVPDRDCCIPVEA